MAMPRPGRDGTETAERSPGRGAVRAPVAFNSTSAQRTEHIVVTLVVIPQLTSYRVTRQQQLTHRLSMAGLTLLRVSVQRCHRCFVVAPCLPIQPRIHRTTPRPPSSSALVIAVHPRTLTFRSAFKRRPPYSHSLLHTAPTSPQPQSETETAATSAPSSLSSSFSSISSLLLHPIFGPHSTPLRVFALFSAVLLVQFAVLDVFTGHGPSMLPTFAMSGEVFLVEALSSYTLPPSTPSPTSLLTLLTPLLRPLFSIHPGDVVLCSNPVKPDHAVAKRVIAMEGQSVRADPRDPSSAFVVPARCVWLQGDCLEASRDSREYGPVPSSMIKGKVVAKLYPLSAARRIVNTLQYRGW